MFVSAPLDCGAQAPSHTGAVPPVVAPAKARACGFATSARTAVWSGGTVHPDYRRPARKPLDKPNHHGITDSSSKDRN